MWILLQATRGVLVAGLGWRKESHVAYFRLRASEERTAALQARDPSARDAHRERAERYEDLVHAITAHEQYLGLELRPAA